MSKAFSTALSLGIAGLTVAVIGTATYAASASQNTKVNVKVNSIISMSVQGDNAGSSAVSTELLPGQTNETMKNTIIVNTNAVDGYVLTVNDVDNNTSMVSETGATIPTGSNITNGVSAWAIKGGARTSWTSMVAANATPITLKTYTSGVANNDTTVVTYGVSTANAQASGIYEDTVVYTATANDVVEPVTMQTFDSSSMLLNNGDTMTLEDERDGKTYTVARLADGNVWMTQNLRLDLDQNKELTPADTDITENWLPGRSTIAYGNISEWDDTDKPVSYNSGNTADGNYYNWSAAIASNTAYEITSGNATTSICPKGWTLPQNGTTGKTYSNLGAAYGLPTTNSSSSTAYQTLEQSPLNFVRAGRVYSGSLGSQGSGGGYWSSTVDSSRYAYDLYYDKHDYNPQNGNLRSVGFSVRCVAR